MDKGKRICRTLKELRKRIADANEIPYEIEECTHMGNCPGTCPKCEKEVCCLMDAISEREKEGKTVVIEGLMSEEDLCRAFYASPLGDELPALPEDYVTEGLPALPEEPEILMGDIAEPDLIGDIAEPEQD